MRIVQLIDSLEAGGAERMAVNYANELASQIDFSGLVVSRKEGMLCESVSKNVNYLFLDRRSTFDLKAIFKLKSFVKTNNIEIIHAHGTSFFLGFLLKLVFFRIKLVWHDHYGDSEFLSKRPDLILKILIPFFNGIVVVNEKLKIWSQNILKFENTIYLPNFAIFDKSEIKSTFLNGENHKRIVCLANLRLQKNHFLLLEVAKEIKSSNPDWTFHLIGKDFNDNYSQIIKQSIVNFDLQNHVFFYGAKKDINFILSQSTIAILTSQSEGLPVAILEYGLNLKAVIATAVGEIPTIIKHNQNGILVQSGNMNNFYTAILNFINNKELITTFGKNLNKTILENFDSKIIIMNYLNWLKNI